jgi:peroxiredoxin
MLQKGETAPDFTLSATPEKTVSLKDLRGKNVILAFYPAGCSPVCSDRMTSYLSPIGQNPGADGILEALENLKN